MRHLYLILLLALQGAATAFGQEFRYVHDSDLYVLVREEARPGAPILDTLYNLQVVKTGVTENGWVEVTGRQGRMGWVHGSRLVPMPEDPAGVLAAGYEERPGQDFLGFIGGTDVPHIFIHCSGLYNNQYEPALQRFDLSLSVPVVCRPRAENVYVYDLRNGEMVASWGALYAIAAFYIYPGRTVFADYCDAQFSFIKDPAGRTCISIVPTGNIPVGFSAERMEEAIHIAENFRSRFGERTDARELSFNYETDHWVFTALYAAYRNGDHRAASLYPFLVFNAHSDGAGGQDQMISIYRLWTLEYAGVTEVSEIAEATRRYDL
ncbi:MAG: SH3 domain-containing protein [Alistipes sp.]|nr:SH3 domain-containing protein [Alistipes sp.]